MGIQFPLRLASIPHQPAHESALDAAQQDGQEESSMLAGVLEQQAARYAGLGVWTAIMDWRCGHPGLATPWWRILWQLGEAAGYGKLQEAEPPSALLYFSMQHGDTSASTRSVPLIAAGG
jgi:hypothetical protein